MSKGAHLKDLKPIIEGMVTDIYLNNRLVLAKEAVGEVNSRLKAKKIDREVSQSLITGFLTKLHEKDRAGQLDLPIDTPWSIGSCQKYNIHSEIIPFLLSEVKRNTNFKHSILFAKSKYHILTIRKARWVAILYSTLLPIIKQQYPNNELQQGGILIRIAAQFARREQIAEINGIDHPDTSDIDKNINDGVPVSELFSNAQIETMTADRKIEPFEGFTKNILEKVFGTLSDEQVNKLNEMVNVVRTKNATDVRIWESSNPKFMTFLHEKGFNFTVDIPMASFLTSLEKTYGDITQQEAEVMFDYSIATDKEQFKKEHEVAFQKLELKKLKSR